MYKKPFSFSFLFLLYYSAEEYGRGISGMPGSLGFLEAKEGEPFIKIGVGVLKKEGRKYFFEKNINSQKGTWFYWIPPEIKLQEYRYEYKKELRFLAIRLNLKFIINSKILDFYQ